MPESLTGVDWAAIAVYLVGVNLLAFAAFGVDKSRARRGAWRISENALMLFAAAGGSIGALAGMHLFHHKTRKPFFSIGVPIVLIVQVAAAFWFLVAVV